MNIQAIVRFLYQKLLTLYPREFRERLGESMEQTFQDLWNEKRRTKNELFGFVSWTFIETALGIFREHLWLVSPGDIMQTILKNIGLPTLISLLLLLPLMIMEVVNRRDFNEEFPFMLFFVMWLNLFAISLILLPILRGRQSGHHDLVNPVTTQGNTLLTNPRTTAILSVVLFLSPVILSWLDSFGWVPPDPEQLYVFGVRVSSQFIALVLISLPVAAGIIAGRPIVSTLRAGGSLFAHPINLTIVFVILASLAWSWGSWTIDQWPCFMGVPNCD